MAQRRIRAPGAPAPASTQAVDALRDRKIAAGFTFDGTVFQSRPQDRENIMGAAMSAIAAILDGAQPGDYRWSDPARDFEWIAADNSRVKMDAQTMVAFGNAALAHKSGLIFAGAAIKARIRAGQAVTIGNAPEWP